jgi:hypothetical protein
MNALQAFISSKPCGFLKDSDLPALIALDRLCPVLVRCGGCRFTCAAQDVPHLIRCIEAGKDYVRDVSITHDAQQNAGQWRPSIVDTGHEGPGSSRGIVRQYNPAVGTWTPIPDTRLAQVAPHLVKIDLPNSKGEA